MISEILKLDVLFFSSKCWKFNADSKNATKKQSTSLVFNVMLHTQQMCDWLSSIVSTIHYNFYKFQFGSSTVLNHLWWRLTNTFLDDQDFYFLPLPSLESLQYTVHFASHVRTNAVCYTLTLNPGFSVSINLEGTLCWRIDLSWRCTTIAAVLFHYAPNVSKLLVWGPNILMIKASSLWHSCYTFDHIFLKKLLYK